MVAKPCHQVLFLVSFLLLLFWLWFCWMGKRSFLLFRVFFSFFLLFGWKINYRQRKSIPSIFIIISIIVCHDDRINKVRAFVSLISTAAVKKMLNGKLKKIIDRFDQKIFLSRLIKRNIDGLGGWPITKRWIK